MTTNGRVSGLPPTTRPFTFPDGPRDWPHHVYRMWDAAGRLLYVGWTEHVGIRMYTHRTGSEWWSEIASYEVETFTERADAQLAERSAIANEGPMHNKARPRPGWSGACLIDVA